MIVKLSKASVKYGMILSILFFGSLGARNAHAIVETQSSPVPAIQTVWTQTIPNIQSAQAISIQKGVLIFGVDYSSTPKGVLVRVANNGTILWRSEVPVSGEGFLGAVTDNQGNIYTYTYVFNNGDKFHLFKFSATGVFQWEKEPGIESQLPAGEKIRLIRSHQNGLYAVSTHAAVKFLSDGTINGTTVSWVKSIPFGQNFFGPGATLFNSATVLPDDNIWIAGSAGSASVFWHLAVLLDKNNGNVISIHESLPFGGGNDTFMDIITLQDGTIAVSKSPYLNSHYNFIQILVGNTVPFMGVVTENALFNGKITQLKDGRLAMMQTELNPTTPENIGITIFKPQQNSYVFQNYSGTVGSGLDPVNIMPGADNEIFILAYNSNNPYQSPPALIKLQAR